MTVWPDDFNANFRPAARCVPARLRASACGVLGLSPQGAFPLRIVTARQRSGRDGSDRAPGGVQVGLAQAGTKFGLGPVQIEQAQAALPDQGGAAATSALQGRRSRKQGACAQGKGLRTVPFSVSGVHGGQSGLAQVCGRARMLQPVDYAAAGVLRIARFVTTELCTVRKQLRKAVADARRYQATAAAQGLKDAKIQVTVLTVVEDNAGAGVEGR